MRLIKIKNFTFVCVSKNTRNGFKHEAQMLINETFVSEATQHWVNRTWESYTYQSVMREAVWKLIIQKEKEYLDEYKKENDLGRLSKDRKREALSIFYSQPEIKELEELTKNLKDNLY